MQINGQSLNGMSAVALVVALGAMGIALWRARRTPSLIVSREKSLENQVNELRATVDTLQRLLYQKQGEVDALAERVRALERLTPVAYSRRLPILLAVLGDDPALSIDLASLREVERQGKFRLSRLLPATMASLKSMLDRHRASGDPIRYVHMAVHACPEGVDLNGELVTAAWLSENLKSVDVLLIGGCRSDALGDWIGIVPAVVTMREDVSHTDAAQFARLFWGGISDGLEVEVAFDAAVERSPQGLAEFVELHL